ncbi:preprotein translocase subunit SecG [Oxalicibacterium solurbis]|uniref:Protein-export membrane protein SecG n=1 Tax=Oxalicibacterium solurbis TaxID=69280 RepID=A0A8J3AWU3_9BURK|nr:preprotein translocase subunit SecG [Oxalicibacterium solurbis]GGI53016.1 preprotein translocase subunit SecG [Oxalicibacterium solurbis]
MNSLHTIIIVVQVLSALVIIGLVLLQHGKGADMGASFGSGASGSLFGATGSSNFLSKSTGVAAVVFFAATLGLAFINNKPVATGGGVMENLPVSSVPGAAPSTEAPATTAKPAASTEQSNEVPK